MEKKTYRQNLERIKEMYPDKELLNINEVGRFLGYTDSRTIRKYVNFGAGNNKKCITVASLAQQLAQ